MDIIKVNDLHYTYNKNDNNPLYALKDVNFSIKTGDFITILGHNGSGKSSLARLLNVLLTPTKGDIYIFSNNTKDSEKTWEIRKTVGMIFQNPDNQIVASTVKDDVAFGLENLGHDPKVIEQEIIDALKIVNMEDFINKTPSLLSGGQKQKVAIAGVLAMKPQCIIFDESTSMLDPKGRKELLDTAIKINKEENITIINITHYMEEAVPSDQVIVLNEGEIVLMGTPIEVFREVDTLKKHSLDIPLATEISYNLKDLGVKISKDILTLEEMVDFICSYN